MTNRPLRKWYHTWLCHVGLLNSLWRSVDVYLWRSASPLCSEYNTICHSLSPFICIYFWLEKKQTKQNNQNEINLFWCKANVKRFSLNNFPQDFDIMRIVHTTMDACRDKRSKENVYYERFKNVHTFSLLLLSQKASIAVWAILMISKSWIRLLKPKRFTLALHKKINSSNLDYSVSSTFFILSDLLPYIYIYIYIYNFLFRFFLIHFLNFPIYFYSPKYVISGLVYFFY